MIDQNVFAEVWGRLCRRFRRDLDATEGADYLAYLNKAGMGTEDFLAQAEAVWATREFFPRPADFLEGEALAGWRALLKLSEMPRGDPDWWNWRDDVPKRAWRAMSVVGGYQTIASAKNIVALRRAYLDAFAGVLIEESTNPEAFAAEKNLSSLPSPQYVPLITERQAHPALVKRNEPDA
jgi:hypothetical protein